MEPLSAPLGETLVGPRAEFLHLVFCSIKERKDSQLVFENNYKIAMKIRKGRIVASLHLGFKRDTSEKWDLGLQARPLL